MRSSKVKLIYYNQLLTARHGPALWPHLYAKGVKKLNSLEKNNVVFYEKKCLTLGVRILSVLGRD